jgi:hypothetical protein
MRKRETRIRKLPVLPLPLEQEGSYGKGFLFIEPRLDRTAKGGTLR